MEELTIEQLEFAREIGATHWDCDSEEYRKDGYLYKNSHWGMGLIADRYFEYGDIIEIDFSPLDDNEASPKPIPAPDYNPADVAFKSTSDGSTASYYELPTDCTELQDLISYRNMNAQDGEIFRAIYRKGRASRSDALRDAKKVLFYAQAEVERLQRYME